MRVECWFDDDDTINRNKLRIMSCEGYPDCVEVSILDVDGTIALDGTIVNAYELIKAVQNAINN